MVKLKLLPVKGKSKFKYIFNNSKKYYIDEAAAFICFRKENDLDEILQSQFVNLNFAVTARKKNCRKAIVRNRIKRLLRASLKELITDISFIDIFQKIQYIFLVWNKPISNPGVINLEIVKSVNKRLLIKISADQNRLTGKVT